MKLSSHTIQAVIFDLDGVLIDSEYMAFQVWREWTESQGGTLDDSVFLEIVGTSAEETAALAMRQSGVQFDVKASCDWTWSEIIRRLETDASPMPGAVELVRSLSSRGIRMAIASNAISNYVDIALRGLGMLEYFPVRVGSDQVTQGKPAPDVYLRAADLLGAVPERCAAVEDSIPGAQAAAAAGMRVLAVPTHSNGHAEFKHAWKVYESLLPVVDDLEAILAN